MGGGGVAVRLVEEEVLPGVVGDQLDSLNLEYGDHFRYGCKPQQRSLGEILLGEHGCGFFWIV